MSEARRAAAPAKVNLALAVTGRRADGFHTLRSVFLRLGLHDDLEVRLQADSQAEDDLVVSGAPDCPVADNLVLRAAESLREVADERLPGLAFALHKRIPVAAGLAGGSSDAAAALDLAAEAWGLRLHPATRLQVALRLGADVPFFASGHPAAFVAGIGEGLEALAPPHPPAGILLVTPPRRLATASVFRALDGGARRERTAAAHVEELVARLRGGLDGEGLAALAADLREANDLWPAAAMLAPELPAMRGRLEAELQRPFLLTGSGPTLLGIYPTRAAAGVAAAQLASSGSLDLDAAAIIATWSAEGTIDEAGD
ncbi:MAG TPA: 4-(cytidine 5'-diphospho)-2-C-methyl-D-erythritol kinase [Vicinamibacteria bacterium]|nr:4-(cytidine 5'-diphospho)-2-C-methyl-D-erythritol kinase [Vicinamibacteria bacterium]